MSGSRTPLLPREHGAWVMLLVPWAIACGVTGPPGWEEVLLGVAVVAAFVAHGQVVEFARTGLRGRAGDPGARERTRWRAALFGALAAGMGLPLVTSGGRPGLLLFAALGAALTAAAVALARARRDRTLAGQLVAAVGLPLTAPATCYVARGAVDRTAVALWGLSVIFFLGELVYVRLKVEARTRTAALTPPLERVRFARRALAASAAMAVAAVGVPPLGGLPWLCALAFVPLAIQMAAGIARLHRPVTLKQMGALATAHAVAFAVLLVGLARA